MGKKHWAGVIGQPISHSLSPQLHLAAYKSLGLNYDYRRIELGKAQLSAFLQNLDEGCIGLSVTMPLKQEIIASLDHVDGLAKAVASVNTVLPSPGGIRAGFNTDVYGIVTAIKEVAGEDYTPRKAVIIGARATASSALAALGHFRPEEVSVVARSIQGEGNVMQAGTRLGIMPSFISLKQLELSRSVIEEADLIISTLPKNVQDEFYATLRPRQSQVLLDVVYDPWPSVLVERYQGVAQIVPGYLMLLHQALMQVKLFTSRTPDVEVMRAALMQALN